jgi:uncharacterized protein YcfJ
MKVRFATLLFSSFAVIGAQSAGAATTYEEADVVDSRPIYRIVEVSSPQEECWEEEVVRQDVRRRGDSYTPGLLGMVIGGALGNAVGHHSTNRKVGTVVGAVLGGSIARDIQRSNDARDSTVSSTPKSAAARCTRAAKRRNWLVMM